MARLKLAVELAAMRLAPVRDGKGNSRERPPAAPKIAFAIVATLDIDVCISAMTGASTRHERAGNEPAMGVWNHSCTSLQIPLATIQNLILTSNK